MFSQLFLQGLKNGDMSWKIQEQSLNWNKILENFWIKCLNLYHIIFCLGCHIWRRYLKMLELFCLQYDLPQVPCIQTWNTCQQQLRTVSPRIQKDHRRVFQGLVHTKSFFKLSDGCLVKNLLQISQLSHSCLTSSFIPGQKTQVLALSIVLLVPKWETWSLFKAFCLNFSRTMILLVPFNTNPSIKDN